MDQWHVHCACVLNVEQVPLRCLVERRLHVAVQGLEVAAAAVAAAAVALAVAAEDCNCVGL